MKNLKAKCINPYCNEVITNTDLSKNEHLRNEHQKFYKLYMDSIKKKLTDKIDYDKFFKVI